jgi:hypothetical protein
MDNVEMAQENLEKAHAHGGEGGTAARRAAVLVAVLAALAVIVEMSANDAQTAYLAQHVAASDLWTQYQAKSVRRTVLLQSAGVMDGQAAAGAAVSERVARAQGEAARMQSEPGGDGMEQLAGRAHEAEHERDHEFRRYHGFERGVRGLQIAIVLSGLFLVTRLWWLLALGVALGGAGGAYALLVGLGLA